MKVDYPSLTHDALAKLESDTFKFFLHEMHPTTNLMPESTREGSPASIAVAGFSLTVNPIAVERGYLSRAEAIKRTLAKLQFFYYGPNSEGPDVIGRKGFYYHFLDMETGHRTWKSEVSTIDTAFLIAGALTAAQYFDRDTSAEREIRRLAEELYRRDFGLIQVELAAVASRTGARAERFKQASAGRVADFVSVKIDDVDLDTVFDFELAEMMQARSPLAVLFEVLSHAF